MTDRMVEITQYGDTWRTYMVASIDREDVPILCELPTDPDELVCGSRWMQQSHDRP